MESRYEVAAWHLAPILNLFSKRKITPRKLLGRENKDDRPLEVRAEEHEALIARMAT